MRPAPFVVPPYAAVFPSAPDVSPPPHVLYLSAGRRIIRAHGNGGQKTARTKNSLARGAEPPPADIHKLFHICLRKRSSFVKNRKTFLQFRQNTAKIGGISPADRPLFCQITKSYPHCAKLLGITLPPKTVRSCSKGAHHAAMPPFYTLPRKSSSARAFPFL